MKETGYSRLSKDLIITEIETLLKNSSAVFLTEHKFISATDMNALRASLRAAGTRYFAVKKSLGAIAMKRASIAELAKGMQGACGIAFSNGDPAKSSKILMDFAKKNENFKVYSGSLDGVGITKEQVKILAELPSREVLLGNVASGMMAPISRFAGVLAGVLRQMVTVLDAIAKKRNNG